MGFGRLETDEPIENPPKPPRDLDTQMLFGCSGFVATSVVTYALGVAPHLFRTSTHLTSTLVFCSAAGLIPAAAFGAYASRKFGLPGGAGFLGGSLAFGVFLFLRIQQVMTFRHARDAPQPDYPESWIWMAPGAWILIALAVILIFLPRDELRIKED